jgi:hypothetical protein
VRTVEGCLSVEVDVGSGMSGTERWHDLGDASLPVELTEHQLWALATGQPVTLSIQRGAGEPAEVTVRPPEPPEPAEPLATAESVSTGDE